MTYRLAQAFVGIGLLVTAPAIAAPVPAPAWAVVQGQSRIAFQSSFGGAGFSGTFRRWAADIKFDPKNLAGSSVRVRIDTGSAATGSPDRDESLPTDDWFAAGKFPQAVFAANQFKDLGGGRYQAIGQLSLRGVTRPLVLPFTLSIQGNQAKMSGGATIDRHAFGVGQGQFATAESVPFAVKIVVNVVAQRAK